MFDNVTVSSAVVTITFVAAAYGAAAGYVIARWQHHQERKRFRRFNRYVANLEREVESLKRRQAMHVVPLHDEQEEKTLSNRRQQ